MENEFQVDIDGRNIIIGITPVYPLTKQQALNLAAWLVAFSTSDPQNDFIPLLRQVLNN